MISERRIKNLERRVDDLENELYWIWRRKLKTRIRLFFVHLFNIEEF